MIDKGSFMTPVMMQAVRQERLGGPDVLQLVSVPRPEPAPTEVLVRVRAAGVNPVDWKTRADGGRLGDPPFGVGWDLAGTVEALGEGVTRFSVGDRVFGMPHFPHEAGAYAEFVTCRSRHLAAIPEGLGDVDAAALPLASLIAWQSLVDTARVAAGDRVLIQGAAGGVGHLAVQIAKHLGAYVVGTAGPQEQQYLRQLGVDEPIDYTRPEAKNIRGVDIVLDLVGGKTGVESLSSLRDGGLLISVPSASGVEAIRAASNDRVRVTGILVEPDRGGIEAIAALATSGALEVRVAQTFPLADAARAHEVGESGEAKGKLVLIVG
jgi:NADPH:quinone reductase-like Zn-dependent oxidoreductase